MFKEERRRTYIYVITSCVRDRSGNPFFKEVRRRKKIATDSPTRRVTPSKKKKKK